MEEGISSLIYLILIWGIPAFVMVRGYLKMNPEDQKSAMSDFKSNSLIFSIVLIATGGFLWHAGTLFAIRAIEIPGFILLIIGGMGAVLKLWKDSKWRSISILVVISLGAYLYVI